MQPMTKMCLAEASNHKKACTFLPGIEIPQININGTSIEFNYLQCQHIEGCRINDQHFLATGAVLGSKSFDTYGDSSAGTALRDYLNAINGE